MLCFVLSEIELQVPILAEWESLLPTTVFLILFSCLVGERMDLMEVFIAPRLGTLRRKLIFLVII